MITESTLLILGAGASVPYGFPTGVGLHDRILELVNDLYYQGIFLKCGHEFSELKEFTEAFRRSGTSSIDAFLEHRPKYLEIGKIAITILIIGCEDEQRLFAGDWYRYVFSKMNSEFDDFKKNKLSVLTFNYDRSFEHFLFTSLKNLYGRSETECREAVESIPIIHLHGKIGNLPWQGGTRPYEEHNLHSLYDNRNMRNWIQEGIDGIKIIHESVVKPSQEFDKAHTLLLDAKRIYFLGFGYHPINVERLKIQKLNRLNLSQATGTTYNLTQTEMRYIQQSQLNNIFNLDMPGARHHKIEEFLREHVVLQ